ncbi:FAD binding domain-containing protein [Infundibulicybe gibba]|nr:FAD binding domain-containing protein [Infundibulicybe gibba]
MANVPAPAFPDNFKGDIITPTHPEYRAAIARWAVNAERNAKVVAFVKDEEDVSIALKYAQANQLPIAIRGGGHNPAGASSSDDGLIIDLSRYLNGAKVDPDARLVRIGGGALWEVVDKEAIVHGLATVAGTVNHVRISDSFCSFRLLLGGGYGWLSSSFGLVIDNLVQATIVTADGSTLTASENQNPDLFFAIRGGGCNFGVATEFILKLYPQQPTVYSGMLVFSPSSLEKLVTATKDWWPTAGDKEGMLQFATVGPDGAVSPVADFTREMPYEELNAIQGVFMKGVAQKVLITHPLPKLSRRLWSVRRKNYQRCPSNTTAFRRDPTPSILISVMWAEDVPEKTDMARAVAYDLVNILKGGQPEMTNDQSLGYSNYDPEGVVTSGNKNSPKKAQLVFGPNYPRLQQIKKKYDPGNIFNKWFPIEPAV